MRSLATRQVKALDRAAELEARAAAVGTGGISADDPEATVKLISKTGDLEVRRDAMKAANAVFERARKARAKAGADDATARAAGWQACVDAGYFTIDEAVQEARLLASCGHDRPFPPFKLTNIGARIRDAKARAARLEADADREPRPNLVGVGVRVVDSVDTNRVQIFFDQKPLGAVCEWLKSYGFRWSPSRGAWQRQASTQAWWAAEYVLKTQGLLP